MALHVYNTRTRRPEPFAPAHPKVVRIYTCGLTVYAPMHIGHARTYCFWDLFRRYLEYRGYHVLSVINYTDIDDRIMGRADEHTGWLDVAEQTIASFRRDCRSLHVKDYAAYTRATDFIEAQVEMTRDLLAKGHAYVVDGEVLYDVQSFDRYGQLSGNTVDGQQAGASGRLGQEARRKRHPADFTLWKPSEPGQPMWETGEAAWPQGRPGWHIECSAMSTAVFGSHFDVHGGAIDNLFPHHENEVAQSEPLCGHPWVTYWMHPEHLIIRRDELEGGATDPGEVDDAVKMSKSLGNVIGIPDLLADHDYDAVRWFFANTHYRTRLAFSAELIVAATTGYKKITRLVRLLQDRLLAATSDERNIPVRSTYASLRTEEDAIPRERESFEYGRFCAISRDFIARFIAAMDDDVCTAQATAAIFDYVNALYADGLEGCDELPCLMAVYRCLVRHLSVLGIELAHPRLYPDLAAESVVAGGEDEANPLRAVLGRLLEIRADARKNKDFSRADLIRDVLADAGVGIEDTPRGARWALEP
ncbi:MAG: cysteine--tRNA ligase [bacterium]|nr:cysteine--tRNA ligase [bacterium]